MPEYLFDKEALRKLIQDSSQDLNRIAISVNPEKPEETIFARAVKFENGTPGDITTPVNSARLEAARPTSEVPGCPNPPGC
ncbi:MAG: hypothetical protein JWQ14_3492 [Adhaeribacter sp.]|nr:hypothetical protein [Adhaeribacter sp.]